MPNAFVTTSLCSPSRASILTGLYAHKHKVVDNNNPVSAEVLPSVPSKSGISDWADTSMIRNGVLITGCLLRGKDLIYRSRMA